MMKLVASLGLAALALVQSTTTVNAWTITSANATQPEEVLGKHQQFVKVWTVAGSAPLDAINFAAAGPVFIDLDSTIAPTAAPATEAPTEAPATEAPTEAPATKASTEAPAPAASIAGSGRGDVGLGGVVSFAAQTNEDKVVGKIIFSGDCTKLLDLIEVVERRGELTVHFKNQDFRGYGYLLTQVVVGAGGALSKITSSGSSGVYVGEGVISSSSDTAEFKVSGDGDIFVSAPKTDFKLKSLDIKVSGSGDVQFQAASLTLADSLSTKISGDATSAVVADSIDVANAIESKISGEGRVFVQAETVTTFKVDTKISGDGDITISSTGSCVSQDIAISGEGHVATGSIACVDTKLRMSGEGSVLVQTSGTFVVPYRIDGRVQYVGTAPTKITDGRKHRPSHPPKRPKRHGWWWEPAEDDDEDSDDDDDYEDDDSRRFLPNSVSHSPVNEYKTYELRPVPPREPTFLILTMNVNHWGGEPNEHVMISILGSDIDIEAGPLVASAQSLAAHVHQQYGPTGAAAFGGLVVCAIVAVGVAVHKVAMQRRRRREYQPLLQVVAN